METSEITRNYLKRFYGDQVSLEYYDMAKPEEEQKVRDLLDKVPKGYLFYPLVFVNGELRIVGSAEYYEILGAVRDLLGDPVSQR